LPAWAIAMTFAFLDFIHYSEWTRHGWFIVKHKTQSQRLARRLTAQRQEAWRLMLAERHRWYAGDLRGHYGPPHDYRALSGPN
jgi:RNA-directed DNA polymerase